MPDRIDLDHVALAFESAWDGLDRYLGDLGGRFVAGGPDPGFSWYQVRYSNGMKVELLEPTNVEQDDFLRRFLDRDGPGPHHVTFKVPDIHAAIERATAAGYPPVRTRVDNPMWREAFLHPKQCHGIVVQLAQTSEEDEAHHHHLTFGELPPSRSRTIAALDRIVHLVADLAAARELFEGVLDGQVTNEGPDDEGPVEAAGKFVDLAWPGAGRIRLVEPADAPRLAWLGSRSGRVHHLAFTSDAELPRGVRHGGRVELAPEHNFGTRLKVESGT